jgi:hypothetical protein
MPFHNFLATVRDETMISQKSTPTGDEVVGHTLDSGPWMYRLVQPSEAPGGWLDLSDEVEYQGVLQSLRKGEGDLALMHVSLHNGGERRGSLLNSTQTVEVGMVARYKEEQDKIRKEWDEGESDEMLIDQSGNVVVFDRGRALDFLHLLSTEP